MNAKKKADKMLSGKQEAAKLLGRSGGLARAAALTKERRREIAVKAAKARWAKRERTMDAGEGV